MYESMAKLIPTGAKGAARVEHFEISEERASLSRIRAVATRGREQPVNPGTYAKLVVNGQLMMSDTQMERDTNRELIRRARGNVLIAGLGLGMVLVPVLKKDKVDTVFVVEQSQDVIDLVAPSFLPEHEDRLFIHKADVLTWEPEPSWTFDVVYFDIWPNIVSTNLDEMRLLHDRFEPTLKPGGWMESWCREELVDLYLGGDW